MIKTLSRSSTEYPETNFRLRISSFLNTCLNYIPCNFQPFALTHFPIIFRPGSWLPGAFLGLSPQAKLSEASFREDALARCGASHTLARSSPTLTSGLRRQRVTWSGIRGDLSMPLSSSPQGCLSSGDPFLLSIPASNKDLISKLLQMSIHGHHGSIPGSF